jgi:hypothetical protein
MKNPDPEKTKRKRIFSPVLARLPFPAKQFCKKPSYPKMRENPFSPSKTVIHPIL